MRYIYILTALLYTSLAMGQGSIIRGTVLDEESGNPIMYADVFIIGTDYSVSADEEGFFNMTNVEAGSYDVVASFIGYKPDTIHVELGEREIKNLSFILPKGNISLSRVNISAQEKQRKEEVRISSVTLSQKQIKLLPSTGGAPDIAQYLSVIPGIIFTGDQGGRLYIRGGAPVQNKILLDGMTIYNAFHSIGFYSVFETAAINNVEVLTGGFDARYGGRISAVVDISMRSGNRKRFSGLVSASPFQAKALLEGPIIPLSEDNKTSLSYLITAKKSLLPYTSRSLYDYAARDKENGLPFDYTDIYGKVSLLSSLGTNWELFGFNFSDMVNYVDLASLKWNSWGAGTNFKVIPPSSNVIVNGGVSISEYAINLDKFDGKPRNNKILNYALHLDLTNVYGDNKLEYGIRMEGFNTEFDFVNNLNHHYDDDQNTIELSAYAKYKFILGDLILDPSVRFQYYATFGEPSFEPRLGLKYNITDKFRLKAATGYYTQNLISTVNENEIVNLFYGFLSGPEAALYSPVTGQKLNTQLQRAIHYVAGVEYDPSHRLQLNLEAYYKDFLNLININNNKRDLNDPDYISVVGEAYGAEFSAKYSSGPWYLWLAYSYGFVNRKDGEQVYPTVFDRRHNLNVLGNFSFGKDDSWTVSARWNFGTGFPFTKTKGFYTFYSFLDGDFPDYKTNNPKEIGIIYDTKRFGGRLPSYHRLDISIKKRIELSENTGLELTASVTNVYDRKNIFYFNRIEYERINQLPILPSIGAKFFF